MFVLFKSSFLGLLLLLGARGVTGVVDFEKQVWPILSKRCVECHKSPHVQAGLLKEPKAGLRLDGAAFIMHGGDSGEVVVVDHPSQSSLYQRVILPIDDSEHMPPKGDPLSRKQKETLRKWIAQGVDFGTWEGSTDGLEELKKKSEKNDQYIPDHLRFFNNLAQGLKELPKELLIELADETGLLIRPIGLGNPLIEVRMVTSSVIITDEKLSLLAPLRNHLVKLDLTGTDLSDLGCREIGDFPQLTHLNLRRTNVGDNGLRDLVALGSLQSLNLCETKVSDQGVGMLLSMENLKSLYLWKSEVSESKKDILRERLKGVEIFP
ncbi:MAG: hypothetical protein CMI27_02335 [Opitutae bacterium]|nr:hypothetical protein [Opitutae bacterium]